MLTVLVTDQQQVGQTAIGHKQHRLTGCLKQCIGGHGGAQPQFLDQVRINPLLPGEPHQLAHGSNSRISGNIRLLRQHLAHQQLARRMTCHQIGERAASVNPELPAVQDNSGRWAQAASSTQRCTLE